MDAINISTLFQISVLFSAFSMISENNLLKYANENQYIGSINARSATTKYNILPLAATVLYCDLANSISIFFYSASVIFSLTISDVFLDNLRFSMSSTSSSIIPFELVSNSKILSSFFFSYVFPDAIDIINSSLVYSTSGISFLTTSPRSCSSRPSSVTVKFITVVRMKISGKKFGLGVLV